MDRFSNDHSWAVDYVPHCHAVGMSPFTSRYPNVEMVVFHIHMVGRMEDAVDALQEVIQVAVDEYDLAPADEWTIGVRFANCN